jgi:hypothetical protein
LFCDFQDFFSHIKIKKEEENNEMIKIIEKTYIFGFLQFFSKYIQKIGVKLGYNTQHGEKHAQNQKDAK